MGRGREDWPPTPTVLAEAAVVPWTVFDLGLGVDVQEGALLVAALPCRDTGHAAPATAGPHPPPPPPPQGWAAVQQRGLGGGAVVSGPGPRPRAQGLKSLSFLTCTWAGMALPSEVTLTEAGTGSTHIK